MSSSKFSFIVSDLGSGVAKAPRTSTETAGTVHEEEEDEPCWYEHGWVPVTKNGKQRTPNQIRGETLTSQVKRRLPLFSAWASTITAFVDS